MIVCNSASRISLRSLQDLSPTTRNVISIIERFYDPLGFLSPVIIQFKKLFQRLCGEQLQWLPDALQREWKTLVDDLRHSSLVSIPRSYHQGILDSVCSYSLCRFCDASTTAYAAVVYFVAKMETSTHTQFLASKTRVPRCRPSRFRD